MRNYKIANNYKSGVSVFGYYLENGTYFFTCINQNLETPQSFFELDFNLPLGEGAELIRSKSNKRVYRPITTP